MLVFSDRQHPGAGDMKDLRHQNAQFAVPQHNNRNVPKIKSAREDLVTGGNRLGENRSLVRKMGGQNAQVFNGQSQEIRKSPVPERDTEHRPAPAMLGKARAAQFAAATGAVDLAHHAFSDKRAIFRLDDLPHKLVPGNTLEIHIPFSQFDIRPAYSRHSDPDKRFRGSRGGFRRVPAEL
jgi:hypothetical protein